MGVAHARGGSRQEDRQPTRFAEGKACKAWARGPGLGAAGGQLASGGPGPERVRAVPRPGVREETARVSSGASRQVRRLARPGRCVGTSQGGVYKVAGGLEPQGRGGKLAGVGFGGPIAKVMSSI